MITLSQALTDTYERIWSKQKSKLDKLYMVQWLCRQRIALLNVDKVTYIALLDFADACPNSAATINRKLATISKALGECVKLGHLPVVPPVPYQPEPKGKIRWLTRREEGLLLAATQVNMTDPEAMGMRSLIVFLVDTGARLGEVIKIAEARGYMGTTVRGRSSQQVISFIDTKSGGNRTVPLTERATIALGLLPDWNGRKCIRLFTKVRNKAGLPDVTLHTLRHTCASRLVQGGMDLYRVKAWLGHSTIKVTERYAHLAPSSLGEGVDILDAGRAAMRAGLQVVSG